MVLTEKRSFVDIAKDFLLKKFQKGSMADKEGFCMILPFLGGIMR